LVKLRTDRPDFILLDLMSEPRDLACREIRSASDVPIIVLTSRNSAQEKVMALDAGADDCVVTPFCLQELLARVRAGAEVVVAHVPAVASEVFDVSGAGDTVVAAIAALLVP